MVFRILLVAKLRNRVDGRIDLPAYLPLNVVQGVHDVSEFRRSDDDEVDVAAARQAAPRRRSVDQREANPAVEGSKSVSERRSQTCRLRKERFQLWINRAGVGCLVVDLASPDSSTQDACVGQLAEVS